MAAVYNKARTATPRAYFGGFAYCPAARAPKSRRKSTKVGHSGGTISKATKTLIRDERNVKSLRYSIPKNEEKNEN